MNNKQKVIAKLTCDDLDNFHIQLAYCNSRGLPLALDRN
jgi:hypothetical protein